MADFSKDPKYKYLWQNAKFKDLASTGSPISIFTNDVGYITSADSSSFDTGSFVTTSSFNSYTGSNTSQFAGTSSFALTSSYLSGSISNAISASYAATASYILNAVSASYATTASYSLSSLSSSYAQTARYVETAQTASYVLNAVSSSYATTASYALTAQTLLGSGAFPYTGSAIISGSLNVIGEFTGSGLNYPTIDGDENQLLSTDSSGTLTFDWADRANIDVKNTSGVALSIGTPVYITGFQGASVFQISAASSSDATKMPAIGVLDEDLAINDQGHATLIGVLRGYDTQTCAVNDSLYVGEGELTKDPPTGSALIQKIARVGSVAHNGEITVIGAGRSNAVPNLLENQIFYGSGSNQAYQTHISGALDSTTINNITSSGVISSSFIGDGSGLTDLTSIRNITSTDTFATERETLNCTSGTFTVSLPTAVGIQGVEYTLVNSGTGIITLASLGGNINGSSTIDLKRQYTSRTVQSDNANWIII